MYPFLLVGSIVTKGKGGGHSPEQLDFAAHTHHHSLTPPSPNNTAVDFITGHNDGPLHMCLKP